MISPIVKRYCTDASKIENYDLAVADKELWHCHHRLELTVNGEYAHSKESLKRLDMYWHRPAFELIFLKPSDHRALHKVSRINVGPKIAKSKIGVKRPDFVRLKISESHKMKATSDFGKWFVETYGVCCIEARKLYGKCRDYWRYHGEFKKFNKEDFV